MWSHDNSTITPRTTPASDPKTPRKYPKYRYIDQHSISAAIALKAVEIRTAQGQRNRREITKANSAVATSRSTREVFHGVAFSIGKLSVATALAIISEPYSGPMGVLC